MATKATKKVERAGKGIKPEDIPGWDDMGPMEKHRAFALASSVGGVGELIPASDFDIGLNFIEVPDICMQWALGRPGYALGRIQAMMGYEGSSKTSFQYWLANLTLQQGGMAAAVFVEHADSTFHMGQYIRPEFLDYFMCYKCDTLEEAIRTSYKVMEDFSKIDPEGEIKKFLIFDSVAGATQEKLLDEESEPGAPKPGGIGGIMSDFVNAMKTRIARTNTLWGVNNQAKDNIPIGFTGAPLPEIEKLVAKGGRAIPFHATYNQIVKRGRTAKVASQMTASGKVVEGFEAKLTFKKNKLGVPMREVQYDVVWNQGFVFQAHTMEFLSMGSILGLKSRSGGSKGTLYYSKELGISETAALNETEMYAAIHSPELLPKFQKELGVITEVAKSSGRGAVPANRDEKIVVQTAPQPPPPPPPPSKKDEPTS